MACPQVYSGATFLSSTLAHVDCQAQTIGSFGFQALSAPNSTGAAVLGGMLTLFVAIFGYRLVLGYTVHGHDVISAVLKIGIVLTLATSWSTFRTLAYDTVLYGPAEVAGAITGASDLSSRYALVGRLENVDSGIIAITAAGTGRGDGDDSEDSVTAPGTGRTNPVRPFAGIAVDDTFGLGIARVAYLAGTLAPLVALRIAAGVLTALAPLIAGLLLFERTQGIFFGWVRSLVWVALGSLVMIVSLSVELALLEPWMSDVLSRRAARFVTPAAPTELLAMTLIFATVAFGLLYLFVRLAFHPGAAMHWMRGTRETILERDRPTIRGGGDTAPASPPHRAALVAERLTTIHRGERSLDRDGGELTARHVSSGGGRTVRVEESTPLPQGQQVPLGASYRRSTRRSSGAATTRDRQH